MSKMERIDQVPITMVDDEQDPISLVIGEHGCWHYKLIFLLSLVCLPCVLHIYSPTFNNALVDFWCLPPEHLSDLPLEIWRNFSQPNGPCTIRYLNWDDYTVSTFPNVDTGLQNPPCTDFIKCTKWGFDKSLFTKTIAGEWNLVCDKEILNVILQSMFLLGAAIGGVVSGFVSDRLGRRTTLLYSLLIQTAIAISSSFSPTFGIYLMCRAILGLVCVAVVYCAFVLSVEIVGGNWVVIAGICNLLPVPITYMIASVISIYIPHWRHYQLVISVLGSGILILRWCIPESPRWLLKVGRLDELEKILRESCSYNRRLLPANFDHILLKMKEYKTERASAINLFKPPLKIITLNLYIMWFTLMLAYFGLVLNVESFGGELHKTSILVAIVEVPAILLSIPVLIKIGRKYPVLLTYIITGVACIIALIIQEVSDNYWAQIIFVMVAKFFIGACNVCLPVYTAELYPTLLRNLGIGGTQITGGFALFIVPFVFAANPPIPLTILGIFGIIASISTYFLPETKNKPLTTKPVLV